VTPVGLNGNVGAARTFSLLMVRTPDVPAVSFTYSAGTGAVTIAAA
jgi:acyl-CoA reductase-like NAD-dependent aldehyde dehydrogenase